MQPDLKDSTGSGESHVPKVSIGMPVYNGDPFIRKALDSLMAQTFTDFELIISDNASTDATGQICQEYANKDPRIKYIKQLVNMGPMANFQFVLDKARAEYFMWAATDDMWDKNFIGECVDCLNNNDDIGIAFSMFWVTSRMYPFVKMKQFPIMAFLCNDNPFTRVAKFIEIDNSTHKANVLYGLWRRNIAKQTVTAFDGVNGRLVYLGLDIAQIVYVLTMHKCFQMPRVLFYKTYKRFPPGHWLNIFIRLYEQWKGRYFSREERIINLQKHFELLQLALKKAGVWDSNYNNMLNSNYEKAKRRI